MEKSIAITATALAIVLFFGVAAASTASVGSAYIYAPAVLLNLNKGTLTTISLNVTAGNGNITINGPSSVGNSTMQSAQTAVAYATSYLGLNEKGYNFTFTINDSDASVSGPSAGLALTTLTISALSHKLLLHDFTLTGTIEADGSVGLIGGAYDKAGIAAEKGMKFIMVPYSSNDSFENLLYYITQSSLGIPVVEVANVSQALQYAFGYNQPQYMSYNPYAPYNLSALPNINSTCSGCYPSAFQNLTAFTMNQTRSMVYRFNSSYQSAKSSMLASLGQDAAIAGKGYSYEAADLAFLTYQEAFAIAESGNVSSASASSVLSGVGSYCSSLTPPYMTKGNYEYLIGGELRQSWANSTLQEAYLLLNNSQTSDDYINAVYLAGESYAWCQAANEMYGIASGIGGGYVSTSTSLGSTAYSAISTARNYGSNIYLQSALHEYSIGNYGAALYDAVYAQIFYGNTTPSNASGMISGINANLANATAGVWPYEFGNSARFLLYNAEQQGNTSNGIAAMQQAYTLSALASGLEGANGQISSSFIAVNASQIAQLTGASALAIQIGRIYVLLLVVIALLIAILVVMLAMLLAPRAQRPMGRRKR